jgi:excinuclease ABC subunit A
LGWDSSNPRFNDFCGNFQPFRAGVNAQDKSIFESECNIQCWKHKAAGASLKFAARILLMKKSSITPNIIGVVSRDDQQTTLRIQPDYRPALKHLNLFSHALVIWHTAGQELLQQDQKVGIYWPAFQTRYLSSLSGLGSSVVKILTLDEKSGEVVVDGLEAWSGAPVLDIKPYFPVEERVYQAQTPERLAQLPAWRQVWQPVWPMPAVFKPETLTFNFIGQVQKLEKRTFLTLEGLGLEAFERWRGFSHLRVLFYFHQFEAEHYRKVTQVEPPYENAPKTGVFATRSPVRPNPIGSTIVKVLALDLEKMQIEVEPFDAFDKTPILDIQPYLPCFERVERFEVPEWVRHWPEWLPEMRTCGVGVEQLLEADDQRMKKYQQAGAGAQESQPVAQKPPRPAPDGEREWIRIRGARQNNLQNIQVDLPKNKLSVITGVSGSGKSSLAFDTIYAESQRRFMGSLSTLSRQAFDQLERPQVDQISGLPPAIAIEQKTLSRNPRSTVGTITEVYDYLRLLYARIGERRCPHCGRVIKVLRPEKIVRLLVDLRPELGFELFKVQDNSLLARFEPGGERGETLRQAVRAGLEAGQGGLMVRVEGGEAFMLSTRQYCYACNQLFFETSPALFSYNNPEGMCPECNGLGVKLRVDVQKIVPAPERSILDNASPWWGNLRQHRKKPSGNWWRSEVLALAEHWQVDLELPWQDLPEDFRRQAIYGSEGLELRYVYQSDTGRSGEIVRQASGAFNHITRLFRDSAGKSSQQFFIQFMSEQPCPSCEGERLALEGRLVTVAGIRYPQAARSNLADLAGWVDQLPASLEAEQRQIAAEVLNEIAWRLQALCEVGVGYLTLDRPAPSLSGGEAQRIRLATQLGCGLTDLLYVLDEPSMGLHPRNHQQLLGALHSLCEAGNTVLVVEHDAETMRAADWLVDLGPGAGRFGGEVMAAGTPQQVMAAPASLTGQYLSGQLRVLPEQIARRSPQRWLKLSGARHHNLKNIDLSLPLGALVCISGVSGSGKSSLISETLAPALGQVLQNSQEFYGSYERLEGYEALDKVIQVTQAPIGRSPRSNPATYVGVFDEIRNLFARTELARQLGFSASRFSFNDKTGCCQACGGEGRQCIEMHFLPDVWVECPECHGKRFNPQTLAVKYQGQSIAEVLEMDINEALAFFAGQPKVSRILQTLVDVGLGYLKLGQSALTLSGGEAQRIKLAKELSRVDTGRTLYILDEPTTGLHFADCKKLLEVLQRLAAAGNSVVVIEHNLEMIYAADWVIDLGPEGGEAGGWLVAEGTPEQVAEVGASITGQYLKSVM